MQSVYTTSELSTSVDVCVDVKEGSLGAVIKVAMSIEGLSAEGMYLHACCIFPVSKLVLRV